MSNENRTSWENYRDTEIARVTPILTDLGYVLDEAQPHTKGERYLMQAVTTESGKKLILLGRDTETDGRVVIKVTSSPDGIRELEHERTCRRVLAEIGFSYQSFLSPKELLFVRTGPYCISVQAFIEQEKPFLDRSIEEQFELALRSFKAQESAHAATYEHARLVRKTFGSMEATGYLRGFERFMACPHGAGELLQKAHDELYNGRHTIEQYGGFLTHTDFVPHNFRVLGNAIYLLDHSSLRFGNKYEGWARFLNFMTLHNRPLEAALLEYVHANRTPEESASLRLMRVYRLGEIICYYTRTLPKSEGSLLALNEARIAFWTEVLAATLEGRTVGDDIVENYRTVRDSLRSDEEKQRQIGLH
ncbi:MAG: hypothetical protein V4682_00130 [Patescibacteria group bacterium]